MAASPPHDVNRALSSLSGPPGASERQGEPQLPAGALVTTAALTAQCAHIIGAAAPSHHLCLPPSLPPSLYQLFFFLWEVEEETPLCSLLKG